MKIQTIVFVGKRKNKPSTIKSKHQYFIDADNIDYNRMTDVYTIGKGGWVPVARCKLRDLAII